MSGEIDDWLGTSRVYSGAGTLDTQRSFIDDPERDDEQNGSRKIPRLAGLGFRCVGQPALDPLDLSIVI